MPKFIRVIELRQPAPADERPLRPSTRPLPTPGPGEIRVRVSVCGVCHTDLHTIEGDLNLPHLPVVPGHQVVGSVEALGPGAERHALGDRVGVGWLHETCGRCDYCRQGRENLCPDARFTGLDVDGGYAEAILVPELYAFPIPAGFADVEAAPLLCAGIVGFRALRLSGIQPGQRLGLYGFGASAHLAIQVARHWGCSVFVFTRSEAHRALARTLGAEHAGSAEDGRSFDLDASVSFAPVGRIVPEALRHLRRGGTLAINAIHTSPIPQFDYSLLYYERTVRSVTNFTRQDAEDFLQLAAEIPIRVEVEIFALEDANEALLRLKRSEIRAAAVLRPG